MQSVAPALFALAIGLPLSVPWPPMRTLLNDPPEVVLSWLQRRQALGQDLHDEVWEGTYHVAPARHPAHGYLDEELAAALRPHARAAGLHGSGPLSVGDPDDYRVPDRSYMRAIATDTFVPTVTIAVEIVSPHDQTWDKLDFYFRRGVDEPLIADPHEQTTRWLVREAEASRSISNRHNGGNDDVPDPRGRAPAVRVPCYRVAVGQASRAPAVVAALTGLRLRGLHPSAAVTRIHLGQNKGTAGLGGARCFGRTALATAVSVRPYPATGSVVSATAELLR